MPPQESGGGFNSSNSADDNDNNNNNNNSAPEDNNGDGDNGNNKDDNNNNSSRSGVCSEEEFQACVMSSPVCQHGLVPLQSDTSLCCSLCKRAERLCSLEDVMSCLSITPTCPENELPEYVSGSCCQSCRLVPPSCHNSCTSDQMCVVPVDAENDVSARPQPSPAPAPVTPPSPSPFFSTPSSLESVAVCRNVTGIQVLFSTQDEARHSILHHASCEDLSFLLSEMINRYCDKPTNVERCSSFEESLRNIRPLLSGSACRGQQGNVRLDVIVPTPLSAEASGVKSSRDNHHLPNEQHINPVHELNKLIKAAVSDTEACAGYQVEPLATEDTTTSAATATTNNNTDAIVAMTIAVALVCLVGR